MNLFRDESINPKRNAQRNLEGRTHYVDEDTLRHHKSRILRTHIVGNGLLFALIESCALNMDNTRRGYRPVVFDIFGTVIERPSIENVCATKAQAEKEMWAILNSIDAVKYTLDAICEQEKRALYDLKELRAKVKKLPK